MSSLEGMENCDDSDDALFLTAVIKCEQEYEEDNEILLLDENGANNGGDNDEDGWSCEDTFLQVCEEVEDVQVKSEFNFAEEGDSKSVSDSELLYMAESVENDNCNFVISGATSLIGLQTVETTLATQESDMEKDSQHNNSTKFQENDMVRTHPEETTDLEEGNIAEQSIPAPPRKVHSMKDRTGVNYHKLIHHEIQIFRNVPSPMVSTEKENPDNCKRSTINNILGSSTLNIDSENERRGIPKSTDKLGEEEENGSCPSDCSYCNTDSEVKMGFNMRDVVLMTSSSEESDPSENTNPQSPFLNTETSNVMTENSVEKETVQSDSNFKGSIPKNSKIARKRQISSQRKPESSESDSSCYVIRCYGNKNRRNSTCVKKRVPNKRRKLQNPKKKQLSKKRLSVSSSSDFIVNTSSESDPDSTSSSNKEDRLKNLRSQKKASIQSKYRISQNREKDIVHQRTLSSSPLTLSALEKLVNESSPALRVVLEDIYPRVASNPKLRSQIKNKSASLLQRESCSSTITRSAAASKKNEWQNDDQNTNEVLSTDDISTSEEIKTYSRSRIVKPGKKYRYRRRHTGNTDEESDEGDSSPKARIEFESDSQSSSAGTGSAVPSDNISDPEEDNEIEEDVSEKCIVCSTLGDTNVKGRYRIPNPYWCKCDRCGIFSTVMRDYDRVCCRELTKVVEFMDDELDTSCQENLCITMHPRFQKDVLDFGAYLRTQKNSYFCSKWAPERKKVYYSMLSFIRWIFDRMVNSDRIMPPACVIKAIREAHMENPNDPHFIPFRPVKCCDTGFHCKAALGLVRSTNNDSNRHW